LISHCRLCRTNIDQGYRKALSEAKGGVIFIDEAYNLGEGQLGKEACDIIVAAMTSETFRDVFIVIADYPDEIYMMLNGSAGL